jgi:parvulin-like peptidyl-prolyl isomerase
MTKTFLHLMLLMALTATVHAKMVDGIALIVEGEAVTTAEIRAVQTQMGVSKEEAINLLIQDRLQKTAMKDIIIPEENIDKKISLIAAQNHVTIPQMQKILKAQGTSWLTYRKSIRDALKKEKFYQDKVVASIPNPSQDELKLYYRNHKDSFTVPTNISLVEYSTPSKEKIEKFLRTHKTSYVKARSLKKSIKDFEPGLLNMLLQTQNGSYTKAINAGDRYIVYKVKSKYGTTSLPFEAAQGTVAAKWRQDQQGKALKDYFEKLRTSADVQVLR